MNVDRFQTEPNEILSFQTSQDPSSPNAVEPGASTSNNLAAGNLLDLRDGWDNEEWGSLEEEPVRRIFLSNFYVVDAVFIFYR